MARRKPRSAGRRSSRQSFLLSKPSTPPPQARGAAGRASPGAIGLGARLLSSLRGGRPHRRNSTGSSGRGTPEVAAPAAPTGGGDDAMACVVDLDAGWPHVQGRSGARSPPARTATLAKVRLT